MKTLTQIEQEAQERVCINLACEAGKHDAQFGEYSPNKRAQEYGQRFRDTFREIQEDRRQRFIEAYTAAFREQRQLIQGIEDLHIHVMFHEATSWE